MCALCCVLFYFSQASAYTPPDTLVTKSERLSSLYSSRILRQPSEEQKAYRVKLVKKFNKLQKRYARSESARRDEKIFLYEYLRRHLIGYFAPQTDDLIDDPHFTWTRAPLGFDIIYTPYDTTSLFQTDPDHTYRALLNGSYFSRFEEGNIHSGFLAFGGELYTTFVGDDPQLTHTFCMTQGGEIDFIANADFTNDLVKRCHRGFQAGPWIYSERDGSVVVKNTSPNRYI